jgi:hypothetical protein
MASRPLLTTEAARQRAAETAERFPGWQVWVTREGTPVATRAGNQKFIDDGIWCATVMADDWHQLETQLAEQAANDAERVSAP